jgi:hypothetical protein
MQPVVGLRPGFAPLAPEGILADAGETDSQRRAVALLESWTDTGAFALFAAILPASPTDGELHQFPRHFGVLLVSFVAIEADGFGARPRCIVHRWEVFALEFAAAVRLVGGSFRGATLFHVVDITLSNVPRNRVRPPVVDLLFKL